MAGHGGSRPGAGGPRGGISETRRLLVAGIKCGLVHAGRAKGLTGTDDEVSIESVARIASDLIMAGQGRDVLAILAQASPKGDEAGAGDTESPLQLAMARMPGLQNGTGVSRAVIEHDGKPAESQENEQRPTDNVSVTHGQQPFFSPQHTLIPPHLEPCARVPSVPPGACELVPGARAAAPAWPADPPTPHPAVPGKGPTLTPEFLKKSFEEKS